VDFRKSMGKSGHDIRNCRNSSETIPEAWELNPEVRPEIGRLLRTSPEVGRDGLVTYQVAPRKKTPTTPRTQRTQRRQRRPTAYPSTFYHSKKASNSPQKQYSDKYSLNFTTLICPQGNLSPQPVLDLPNPTPHLHPMPQTHDEPCEIRLQQTTS
jgi:hypothetical protein